MKGLGNWLAGSVSQVSCQEMSGEMGEKTSHFSSVLNVNTLSPQSILLMLHRCYRKKRIRVPCSYTAFFLWSRNNEEGPRVKLWVQRSILSNMPAYRVPISERSTGDESPCVLPSPCPQQASTIKAIRLHPASPPPCSNANIMPVSEKHNLYLRFLDKLEFQCSSS